MTQPNSNQAIELNLAAETHFEQDQYSRSEELLQQALTIAEDIDDERLKAAITNNLGLVHKSREQYSEALTLYNQALEIYRQLGDSISQADVLDNIGFVHYTLAEYSEALKCYQEALELCHSDDLEAKERILQNILSTTTTILRERTEFSARIDSFREIGIENPNRLVANLKDNIWKRRPGE
jgi:tetratricopeptide (TPR) repeat protein